MNKKYTINDNYTEIEKAVNALISYTKIYAIDMICKIKCYNLDNGNLDIFAFNNISRIVLAEDFSKVLVYYNEDDSILISLKSYNNVDFEIFDLEDFEIEKESALSNSIEICLTK